MSSASEMFRWTVPWTNFSVAPGWHDPHVAWMFEAWIVERGSDDG
jgi:hypothetical protein